MARVRKTNNRMISAVIFLCILLLYFFFSPQKAEPTFVTDGEGVYVHFVDVGQGDCVLVQAPEGNLLIDAGTPDSADALIAYIDALGIDRFAYAIFTHPHADHIGSAARLLERYAFEHVYIPDAVSTTDTYDKLLTALEDENCMVSEGRGGVSFAVGQLEVELFAPGKAYEETDDLNNASIVAKASYGSVSFLFTGDAETASEKEMLQIYGSRLDVDVLKVGHHGSYTSSSSAFLNTVTPEVSVMSCGLYNEYGHPHGEVVDRLEEIGSKMYRTDLQGSILVHTDGTTYTVQTEK